MCVLCYSAGKRLLEAWGLWTGLHETLPLAGLAFWPFSVTNLRCEYNLYAVTGVLTVNPWGTSGTMDTKCYLSEFYSWKKMVWNLSLLNYLLPFAHHILALKWAEIVDSAGSLWRLGFDHDLQAYPDSWGSTQNPLERWQLGISARLTPSKCLPWPTG